MRSLCNMPFHRNNHYVPCLYLKRFAGDDGRVATYPILVADNRVPDWKQNSTKAVAYRAHLYTRMVSGEESDEVETWLKRMFEDPAEDALGKERGWLWVINRATSAATPKAT
jgi:Protein of unknown function (DUF4238)